MEHEVNPNCDLQCDVTAQPQRTAAGGIVLITITPPHHKYSIVWTVVGPVQLSVNDTRIALLGATSVTAGEITVTPENPVIRATLDTTPLAEGSWIVRATLTNCDYPQGGAEGTDGDGDCRVYNAETEPIIVQPRPFGSGDDVSVTMKRAAVAPTADQALWVAIRNSTNAIGFESYRQFMDRVFCEDNPGSINGRDVRHKLRKVGRRTALPFSHVDQYRLLNVATEVFLMLHSGVNLTDLDLEEESARLNRRVAEGDLEALFQEYLTPVPTGDGRLLDVLPYLGLIRLKLRDVPIVGSPDDDEAARVCFGILAEKLTKPCFIELFWSYWMERAGLPRTVGAISWRFQNRASGPGRDPLIGLDIDPLRSLNNLLWGYVQDAGHRLTPGRRSTEYAHLYGTELDLRPRSGFRVADSRSRFVEAFHNLLTLSAEFYKEDDNTTVIADGFSLLNALRDVHLLLSEGAHNQYGDLPWTARQEMLMEQWILTQPQVREFLPTRTMVDYTEDWIEPVDAMSRLQNWSDVSALHHRDLAVFGEQLLLGIRFGDWARAIAAEQAANWARYWRREVRGYIHAFRAVSGIDLAQPVRRTATQRVTANTYAPFPN